jgi:hypothetical protein
VSVEQENNNINIKDSQELGIWSLYLFALKSPVTREKYKTRLDKFFNFIGLKGDTVEEKSDSFIERYKVEGGQWVFHSILKLILNIDNKKRPYFRLQMEKIDIEKLEQAYIQ